MPIKDTLIEDEVKDSYLNYAMSVIVSRALPDVRDGLKPSQRRILIAMNDLGLTPRSKHRKCAKIVGETMGNYHPHGDQSIYPTLVRLAQDFVCRYTLVDSQGNFGSIDGDPPAAMRYTEARMADFATLLIEDLDKNTVDFVPNFDESREEPTVLPSKFPNLICNGSSGIAVGMATNIPPHNLTEVCDGIIKVINDPDVAVEDLMKIVKGPDFPTGGYICGMSGVTEAYKTGRGLVTLRAKLHTEQAKGGKVSIVFTEIPYNVNKTRILETIAALVKEGRTESIADVRDESDREGIRVVVEVKRGEEEQLVINQLYENTPLQVTFGINMVALVRNQPRTLGLKELLQHYIDHRVEVIRRRTQFLLEKAEAEAHILEGLVIAVANIDEVIEIIKKAPTIPAAEASLVRRFNLSVLQAQAILRMQLQRLVGLERDKLLSDLAALREKIAEYRAILADSGLVLDILREDLYEMKEKCGDKRRTEIIAEVQEFAKEDLIAEEDVAVMLSHQGYIKRMALSSYRKQRRGGKGIASADIREGDFMERIFIANTHDYILFFTDLGKVYWQKVYDIPELSRASKGRAIVNLLTLAEGEKITSTVPVRSFDSRFLLMATRRGTVKKTPLEAFSRPKRGGIRAINLDEDDRLIGVVVTGGDNRVVIGTDNGMSICFHEKDIRSMGRTAAGNRGIRPRKGDSARGLVLVDENKTLLTVCERGFGKRTPFSEYRLQRRGGTGVVNIRTGNRNGVVVGMKSVGEDDELLMVTIRGMMVRIPVGTVRQTLRNAMGVKLITLEEGDKLVSIASLASEEGANGHDATPPVEGAAAPVAHKGDFSDAGPAGDETVTDEEPAPGSESDAEPGEEGDGERLDS
ncbi:MAG: DNA gyrase subunit A [Planctomycetota bacterium]|nr:DNA gyrase subunit A [Planctomycetota bacterium]